MKLGLKIFLGNIHNCVIGLICTFFVSAMVFVFEGIKEIIISPMNWDQKMHSSIGIISQTYIVIIYFIGGILIFYSMNKYFRMRLKDYGMFLAFGYETKNLVYLMILECACVYAVSYVLGCLAGYAVFVLIDNYFVKEGIVKKVNYFLGIKVAGTVFLYIMIAVIVTILINLFILKRRSVFSIINQNVKSSKIPGVKESLLGSFIGTIGLLFSMYLLRKYPPITYSRMKYGIIFCLLGVFCVFKYIGSLALELLKKNKRLYYKELLNLKSLFYRFSENKNIIMILFVIDFIVLLFVNINIIEYKNTSSKYLWKYPYDYVWMASEENADIISSQMNLICNKTREYPYVSLESYDKGQYVGISLKTYNDVTNNNEVLQPGEVIAIMQKEKNDSEKMIQGNQIELLIEEKQMRCNVVNEIKEVLFIAQQPEMINILVLSNEDFDEIELMKGTGSRIIVSKEKKSTELFPDSTEQLQKQTKANLFTKEALMKEDRKEDVMTLLYYICMGVFFMFCNMTVIVMKTFSDIPELTMKYSFLHKLGMNRKRIKSCLKKELLICMAIPLVTSGAIVLFVLDRIISFDDKKVLMQVGIFYVAIIIIQVIYAIVVERYGLYMVIRRNFK